MNNPAAPVRPLWFIVLCTGTIVGMGMGLRQVMGLYLRPVTMDLGLGREPFSNALAIANLVWGFAAIATGGIADRFGAGRIVVFGALCTMSGLYLMAIAQSSVTLMISGVLLGLGVSGTGVTALVGAVGRAAPAERRTAAIASLGMASGIGGFLAFPYAHVLIEALGWRTSLMVLTATGAIMLPLALSLRGTRAATIAGAPKPQILRNAFREAFALPSFWLLVIGFFVCGFHVTFYSAHLPAFVQDQGLGAWVGVWSLMAVGIANIIGTWLAGQSGRYFEKRQVLTFIYLARAVLFLAILYLPITGASIIVISGLLGLFWLSTIPLTSGLVATFFGTHWMSMLFGFVFLSHQLGSFAGLWMAGWLFDMTHSYDAMWWVSIGLALTAAALNWPIRERPVSRVLAQSAAE
jgi:predicted MFS family arabinose efflux permease